MAAKLILALEVEQDLADAFAWYESQRSGLGARFLDCVDACFHSICRSPQMYVRVHQEYRRALLRTFPYAVFYELADDRVIVYGVIHTAREPTKWKSRLP